MARFLSDFGPPADASNAHDRQSWIGYIEEIAADQGYFQSLGQNHFAFFTEGSPSLLVSFETLDQIRHDHPSQMPVGYRKARESGWSHLTVVADGSTWWRDAAVYGYFDRLLDQGFFEDFDRVVFYGAKAGGYAAAAFSVTAPGSTVFAVQPVATLDPSVAGWDPRFRTDRRLEFRGRYGYAPDMIDAADQVYVLFDPLEPLDAMHAALFKGPQVVHLTCPHLGSDIATALDRMGMLPGLMDAVLDDRLTQPLFAQVWRGRHLHPDYLMRLVDLNVARGRIDRAQRLCRSAVRSDVDPRFEQRLADLQPR